MNVSWTPPLTERFEMLIAKGVSYKEIAKILSREFSVRLTKNACVGKGRRLEVPLRQPPRKRQSCQRRNALRKAALKRKQRGASLSRKSGQRRKRLLTKRLLRSQKRRERPNRKRDLTLLQLLPTSCRWPTGNNAPFTFCGADKADGSSYCHQHALIASPSYGRVR